MYTCILGQAATRSEIKKDNINSKKNIPQPLIRIVFFKSFGNQEFKSLLLWNLIRTHTRVIILFVLVLKKMLPSLSSSVLSWQMNSLPGTLWSQSLKKKKK